MFFVPALRVSLFHPQTKTNSETCFANDNEFREDELQPEDVFRRLPRRQISPENESLAEDEFDEGYRVP